MIDDLLKSVEGLRSDAQDIRRKARKEASPQERERLFTEAVAGFGEAIAKLERGLRTVRRKDPEYDMDVCRILEALSQSYGSLGGTWRDCGEHLRARQQYDEGFKIEEERRIHCGAKDTYNMLQRLIVRLLIDPKLITDTEFLSELNTVREEIERQVNDGRDDSWALADLALSRFLCGIEADTAISDLERRKVEGTFYESAHNALAALVAEGLGKGEALGDRLEAFKKMLQRRGGLP